MPRQFVDICLICSTSDHT